MDLLCCSRNKTTKRTSTEGRRLATARRSRFRRGSELRAVVRDVEVPERVELGVLRESPMCRLRSCGKGGVRGNEHTGGKTPTYSNLGGGLLLYRACFAGWLGHAIAV